MEMEVKGTLILDYVKFVRANKDKHWDKWLTPQDWDVVNSLVLASKWYPFETWQRLGAAVFNEVAGKNLSLIQAYGPVVMGNLLKTYKNVLVEGDPLASIDKFESLRRNFLRGTGSDLEVVEKSGRSVKIKMHVNEMDRKIGEPEGFAYAVSGSVQELVKRAGGKTPTTTITPVEGGYELVVTWE